MVKRATPKGSFGGVVTVGSAVALSLFGDMAMYVILPVQYVELGISAIQVGILLSANRWVRLITNRVAEKALHHFGGSLLFPSALLCGSLLAVAYSTAPTFVILLLLRMVWGLCWSFIRHTGVMTTIRIAGSQSAGRRMGIYVALLQAGFVAGTFAAGILFDATGFRTTFLLAAAMSLAALPPALLSGRRSAATDIHQREKQTPLVLVSVLLSLRGFIVSLVGAGLVMSTLGYLLRSRFGDAISIGTAVIGITTVNGAMLAAQYVINGAGSPLFGVLIDRHGLSQSQVVAFAASGATLLAAGILQATPVLVPLVIVFFVSASVARLAVESQAALAGPRAYSGLATATDLGSAVGPVLGWVGIELAHSNLLFWVGSSLFFIGAILAIVPQSCASRRSG